MSRRARRPARPSRSSSATLDELRERAGERLEVLHAAGESSARLYGDDPGTASAAGARSSCCSTSPRCTACRPTGLAHARPRRDVACRGGRGRGAAGAGSRWRASVARRVSDSYYGRPVLKEPVWKWEIPAYFFTGGLAGAAAPFALLSELRGDEALARRAWLVALAGAAASPPLLIADLGRPERFHQHAAGVQAHLADEHRLLDPRRQQHRHRASRTRARHLGWFPRLGRLAGLPPPCSARCSRPTPPC